MFSRIDELLLAPFAAHFSAPLPGVRMLMYHSITEHRDGWRWSLPLSRFENHLQILKQQNWHSATIDELSEWESLPAKTVFITFDDGFVDNWAAFELMQKYRMKATWYIVAGAVKQGQSNWDANNKAGRTLLNWDQIRALASAGMGIGSHSMTHSDLSAVTPNQLERELRDSKQLLEQQLQREILSLAYPFGRYNDQVLQTARTVGYRWGLSVRSGALRNLQQPHLLPRLAIVNNDHASRFRLKLAFADSNMGWRRLGRYVFNRITA